MKDDIVKYYDIEKYNLFASCRKIGEGGGTAIYIHSRHDVLERNDLKSIEFETTFIEVKLATRSGMKNIVVGEIYRPPKSNNAAFLSYVEQTLDTIENERKLSLLAGDFNYNLLPVLQNKQTNDFANLMTSYGFFPLISKATRIQNETETLLDNVFTNDLTVICSSGIFVDDLSDHFPIFASLKFTNIKRHDRECITVFDKSKMADLNDFLLLRLKNFQKNNDVNMASEELVEAYVHGIRTFSKTFRPCRRKSSIKPWITPGILCSINMKTKLYSKFMRRRNENNETKYKNIVMCLLKQSGMQKSCISKIILVDIGKIAR